MAHHETSTGVLHDLEPLKRLSRERGFKLCLDCISSIGAIPVDLRGVHLASGSSGKALAALPGLGLVFHQEKPAVRPDLPRYLDLGMWSGSDGVPFTHSSNLVAALDIALAEVERLPSGRCGDGSLAAWLRAELRAAGFALWPRSPTPRRSSSPWCFPRTSERSTSEPRSSSLGFLTSHRSGYLAARNWIQFSLMSSPPKEALAQLVSHLRDLAAPAGAAEQIA